MHRELGEASRAHDANTPAWASTLTPLDPEARGIRVYAPRLLGGGRRARAGPGPPRPCEAAGQGGLGAAWAGRPPRCECGRPLRRPTPPARPGIDASPALGTGGPDHWAAGR